MRSLFQNIISVNFLSNFTGKKGHHKKGHHDEEHKGNKYIITILENSIIFINEIFWMFLFIQNYIGHKGKHGHDKHFNHEDKYEKKGGKKGGHEKGYEKKGEWMAVNF